MSRPADPLEREADRVAAAVVDSKAPATRTAVAGLSAPSAPQRKCEECEREEQIVQRVAESGGEESAAVTLPPVPEGSPLGAPVRGFMESRFGHDFSRVRVHADPSAQASARAFHARAFTLGADVFFAQGQYEPDTQAGRRLLAHELAHVVQQSRGARSIQRQDDDDSTSTPDGGAAQPLGPTAGTATCGITVPNDADTQLLVGAVFAEADPKRTTNDEREEIAGVFYNRVEHVYFLCNGTICGNLNDKQRKAQCARDKTDFGDTFKASITTGSVAFGSTRWSLVMNSTTMKPASDLCLLPQSEINAVIAATNAATTIMASGANDDAVAFNKGKPPSARMQQLTTIGKHNFHDFKDGRECG